MCLDLIDQELDPHFCSDNNDPPEPADDDAVEPLDNNKSPEAHADSGNVKLLDKNDADADNTLAGSNAGAGEDKNAEE